MIAAIDLPMPMLEQRSQIHGHADAHRMCVLSVVARSCDALANGA